jgi:hypothetical protein
MDQRGGETVGIPPPIAEPAAPEFATVGELGGEHDPNRRNALRHRKLNELIAKLSTVDGDPGSRISLVCECGKDDCMQTVELTWSEYDALRAHGLALAPNHVKVEPGTALPEMPAAVVGEDAEVAPDCARQQAGAIAKA